MPNKGACPTRMSELEKEAVRKFGATYIDTLYPIPVAEVLRKSCIIDEDLFVQIKQMQQAHVPRKIICERLVNETMSRCCLEELIQTLYDNDMKDLAKGLFRCYQDCKNSVAILRLNRTDTSSRRKIGKYFKHIKQLVHELAFKNAHETVKNLGEQMKLKIAQCGDPYEKMNLCDQFIALKAAEMDALTNIAGIVSKDHPGYREMSRYVTSTTNPALSNVILFGRQSDVLSTTGDFNEAEEYMKNALVNADTSGPCVEVTDMIYKNVVVKLSKFERNLGDEQLRKSILYEADRGLWTLHEEQEDLRIFWTKLFLLRMAFAHLGIGKFCHVVKDYVPTMESIVAAEKILQLDPLKDLEHRRQMFIAVAQARLNEWKGNMDNAMAYLKLARKLAGEGKYAEDKALEEYEALLSKTPWQTAFNTKRNENMSVTDINDDLMHWPSLPSEFSFSSTDEISQSSADEETNEKETSNSENISVTTGQTSSIDLPEDTNSSDRSLEHLETQSLHDESLGLQNLQSLNDDQSDVSNNSSLQVQLNDSSFFSLEHLHLSSFESK